MSAAGSVSLAVGVRPSDRESGSASPCAGDTRSDSSARCRATSARCALRPRPAWRRAATGRDPASSCRPGKSLCLWQARQRTSKASLPRSAEAGFGTPFGRLDVLERLARWPAGTRRCREFRSARTSATRPGPCASRVLATGRRTAASWSRDGSRSACESRSRGSRSRPCWPRAAGWGRPCAACRASRRRRAALTSFVVVVRIAGQASSASSASRSASAREWRCPAGCNDIAWPSCFCWSFRPPLANSACAAAE